MQYLVIARSTLAGLGINLTPGSIINEDTVDQAILDKAVLTEGRWVYAKRNGDLNEYDPSADIVVGLHLILSEEDAIFAKISFTDRIVGESDSTIAELLSINSSILIDRARLSHSFRDTGVYRRGWISQLVEGKIMLCRYAELIAADLKQHSPMA